MKSKNFSIVQALNFTITAMLSWQKFSRLFLVQTIIMASFLVFFASLEVLTGLKGLFAEAYPVELLNFLPGHYNLNVIFCVAGLVILSIATAWVVRICLDIYDSGKATLLDSLLSIREVAFGFFLLSLIVVITQIVIIMGGVLLIFPGIVSLVMWWFAPWVLIDKKEGLIKALQEGWRLVRGIRLKIFVLITLVVLVPMVPEVLFSIMVDEHFIKNVDWFLISPIVSIVILLSSTFVYRSLQRPSF